MLAPLSTMAIFVLDIYGGPREFTINAYHGEPVFVFPFSSDLLLQITALVNDNDFISILDH